MSTDARFANAEIADRFAAYPETVRQRLLELRTLIFATAARTPGVGKLVETLKWGQPAYVTTGPRSGTTIRIDLHSADGGTSNPAATEQYALYVHCQTDLIARFRDQYEDLLRFEGNRAIVFDAQAQVPTAALERFVAAALRYHVDKRL